MQIISPIALPFSGNPTKETKRKEKKRQAALIAADIERRKKKEPSFRIDDLLSSTAYHLDRRMPPIAACLHRYFSKKESPTPIVIDGAQYGDTAVALRLAQAHLLSNLPNVMTILANRFPILRRDIHPSQLKADNPDADWVAGNVRIYENKPFFKTLTSYLQITNPSKKLGLSIAPELLHSLGEFQQVDVSKAPPLPARQEARLTTGLWHFLSDADSKTAYLQSIAHQQAPGSLLILDDIDAGGTHGIPKQVLGSVGYKPSTDDVNQFLVRHIKKPFVVLDPHKEAARQTIMQHHGWSETDPPIFVWEKT